jgi:hypothetical protein
MKNRRVDIDLGRKLKKVESFQLSEPSDLRPLGLFAQAEQSAGFAEGSPPQSVGKKIGF